MKLSVVSQTHCRIDVLPAFALWPLQVLGTETGAGCEAWGEHIVNRKREREGLRGRRCKRTVGAAQI